MSGILEKNACVMCKKQLKLYSLPICRDSMRLQRRVEIRRLELDCASTVRCASNVAFFENSFDGEDVRCLQSRLTYVESCDSQCNLPAKFLFHYFFNVVEARSEVNMRGRLVAHSAKLSAMAMAINPAITQPTKLAGPRYWIPKEATT